MLKGPTSDVKASIIFGHTSFFQFNCNPTSPIAPQTFSLERSHGQDNLVSESGWGAGLYVRKASESAVSAQVVSLPTHVLACPIPNHPWQINQEPLHGLSVLRSWRVARFHRTCWVGSPMARLLIFPLGEERGEKCGDASGAAALVVSSGQNLKQTVDFTASGELCSWKGEARGSSRVQCHLRESPHGPRWWP